MDIKNIIIGILGSTTILVPSMITLVLSTLFFNPMQEKKKYIFDEKKKMYESIIIFAQIVLYPQETKYSLSVANYKMQNLSDEQNIKNSVNDLKMIIPKLKLITQSDNVIEKTERFIENKNIESFNILVAELRKDLYR